IAHFYFWRTGLYFQYPHLLGISNTMLFLFGPLFYLYVKILIDKNYKFKKTDLLHFLPFILFILYGIPFYIMSRQEKLDYLRQFSFYQGLYSYFIALSQIIQLYVYIFLVRHLVNEHDRKIRDVASSIEKINLSWINKGIFAFFVIFGVMLVLLVLALFGLKTGELFQVIIPVMVSITIFIIGYLGLRLPEIPATSLKADKDKTDNTKIDTTDEINITETDNKETDNKETDNKDAAAKDNPTLYLDKGANFLTTPERDHVQKKYEKSSLTPEKAEECLKCLKILMDKEKPYLDSELSLQKLSSLLEITPHHLSQVLNENLELSFFDFVNSYRIEEAKKLLLSPKSELLTILAIAEESGFNSKSAFNTAFKKFTSLTPSEFKKQNT
ncbi:MAG: helix-turn-helix domain-containing protein, partial [Bacillota bacterium]